MKYQSVKFVTRNEYGDREITLTPHKSFIDWLLRRMPKTKQFVQQSPSTTWYHKDTGEPAGTYWDYELLGVVEYFRQLDNKYK